ncbi:MAG: glycosyltransferase family 4 protein [Ignavibacteria bacterium]|nr:glycosyltransferase family 4 protein [Ignavibacteria bacterium]
MVEIQNEKLRIAFWRIDYAGALVDAGINSTIRGLITELVKSGHKVFHISGSRAKLPNEVESFHIPFSKIFRNFPEVFSFPYQFKSVSLGKRIIKNLEPINFIYQVIHDFNFSGAVVRKNLGIPLFLQADGIQVWVKQNWGKLYFKSLLRWAEEIQWSFADKIFTFSSQLREQLKSYGVPETKIVINPCGFNPEVFHPNIDCKEIINQLNIANKFVVGFSGTFGYYHGISFLAKSIKMVAKAIPNVVFLFVGDGSYRAQLDEIIKQDNVEKFTIITGFVPFEDVPKYLSCCDVLVSPCINNDDGTEFFNSPLKNFEYMGLRKPIIATAVGQQKEIFKHRWSALLVEERNPEAIAEAIIELYNNPDLSATIAINAFNEGISKHTWRHRAENLLNSYFELINSKI